MREDEAAGTHQKFPSITLKEEPFLSPREMEQIYNRDSPRHVKSFAAKLEEAKSKIDVHLANWDYKQALEVVKRTAQIAPSEAQELSLFKAIEDFAQQREIVNQNRFEDELERYRAAKATSGSHSRRDSVSQNGSSQRKDDLDEPANKSLEEGEVDAEERADSEEHSSRKPYQYLQNVKTSEYKQEIADDILDIAKISSTKLVEPDLPSTPKPQLTKLTFDDFKAIILPWYNENEILSVQEAAKKESLEAKLAATILEYQNMREAKAAIGEDVTAIDIILKTLKTQQAKTKTVEVKPIPDKVFWDQCKRNLHEAFVFYAKQQRLIGNKPSFDDISRNLSTLNIGKFLRFFRDFGIMGENKREDEPRHLERKLLIKIFMKHSILHKEMEESHFLEALDTVAKVFYKKNPDLQDSSIEEKRKIFYKNLEIDNFEVMHKKFIGFGKAFGSNTDNRIPPNDPAKRYKYRQTGEQRLSVEEFKKLRATKVIQESPKFEPMHKAPADAIVSYQNPAKLGKIENGKKGRNPFTWQGLGDMQPEQLKDTDDEFDIKDLVVDDSSDEDEYLAKQFPASPQQEGFFITAPK